MMFGCSEQIAPVAQTGGTNLPPKNNPRKPESDSGLHQESASKINKVFALAKQYGTGGSVTTLKEKFEKLENDQLTKLSAEEDSEGNFLIHLVKGKATPETAQIVTKFLDVIGPFQSSKQAKKQIKGKTAFDILRDMTRPADEDAENRLAVLGALLPHDADRVNELRDAHQTFEASLFNRIMKQLTASKIMSVKNRLADANYIAWFAWAVRNSNAAQPVFSALYTQGSDGTKKDMVRRLWDALSPSYDTLADFITKDIVAADNWGVKTELITGKLREIVSAQFAHRTGRGKADFKALLYDSTMSASNKESMMSELLRLASAGGEVNEVIESMLSTRGDEWGLRSITFQGAASLRNVVEHLHNKRDAGGRGVFKNLYNDNGPTERKKMLMTLMGVASANSVNLDNFVEEAIDVAKDSWGIHNDFNNREILEALVPLLHTNIGLKSIDKLYASPAIDARNKDVIVKKLLSLKTNRYEKYVDVQGAVVTLSINYNISKNVNQILSLVVELQFEQRDSYGKEAFKSLYTDPKIIAHGKGVMRESLTNAAAKAGALRAIVDGFTSGKDDWGLRSDFLDYAVVLIRAIYNNSEVQGFNILLKDDSNLDQNLILSSLIEVARDEKIKDAIEGALNYSNGIANVGELANNEITATIEMVSHGGIAGVIASLNAIKAQLNTGTSPFVALAHSGIGAQEIAALKPVLVKVGIKGVIAALVDDFIPQNLLKSLSFYPFGGTTPVRLLFAVLKQAKTDAGTLTEAMVKPLAHELKMKFVEDDHYWQNYLNENNDGPDSSIEKDLVRDAAGNMATSRAWLHYDAP